MNEDNNVQINIAKDFSIYPGARYRNDGKFSGEEFYEVWLKPKFQEVWEDPQKTLILDLDGTFGYASSFISEVFMRLVRDFKDKENIKKKLQFKSDDEPLLVNSIKRIIDETTVE